MSVGGIPSLLRSGGGGGPGAVKSHWRYAVYAPTGTSGPSASPFDHLLTATATVILL